MISVSLRDENTKALPGWTNLPELAVWPMPINVSIKKDGWVFEPAALLILMDRQLQTISTFKIYE